MECRLTHRVHGQLAINASPPTVPAANAKTPYAANGADERPARFEGGAVDQQAQHEDA